MGHWLLQRGSAVLALCGVVGALLIDVRLLMLVGLILGIHIDQGVNSMLTDYVHTESVKRACSLGVFILIVLILLGWISLLG